MVRTAASERLLVVMSRIKLPSIFRRVTGSWWM
jgi:hypothetical protein